MSTAPPSTIPSPPTTTTTIPQRTLRISTRSSALALAQTALFTRLLSSHPHPPIALTATSTHPITTSLGDTNKHTALHTLASAAEAGGKSLWTEDLEAELLAGRVDVIVHSLKDVPTRLPVGCVCSAVGAREEGRDCVVLSPKWEGWRKEQRDTGEVMVSGLECLPRGSVVGTSSIRRQAMIRRVYPELVIKDMRGNVPTRFQKLDDPSRGYDAIVVAGAGVLRLGMGGRISGWLDRRVGVLHAVGQGAIGVEWREGDAWVGGLVEGLKGVGSREKRVGWEGGAERELLRVLEGGCSVPVGVECVWEEEGRIEGEGKGECGQQLRDEGGVDQGSHVHGGEDAAGMLVMRGMVVSVDGNKCVEGMRKHWVSSDAEAEECGWRLAQELVEKGAGEILKDIVLNRDAIRAQGGA